MGGQAHQNLRNTQRFDDVIDTAAGETLQDLFGFRQACHEYHRYVGPVRRGLELAAQGEAIHSRHDRVEQDAVGDHDFQALQCFFGITRRQHRIAFCGKGVAQHAQGVNGVIHNQDDVAWGNGFSLTGHDRARVDGWPGSGNRSARPESAEIEA